MNNIELILNCCKHYDEIVNYSIDDSDFISKDLISYYKEYVFFNYDDKKKIRLLDKIMYEYIRNKEFYSYIQDKLNTGEILPIDSDINKIYKEFKVNSIRVINSCKWI